MAYSSILGADSAAQQPAGRGADSLGPSDNSDSGSDSIGTREEHADSDSAGTGERGAVAGRDGREGGDIMPDRVVNLADGEVEGAGAADLDGAEFTDLDDEEPDAQDEGQAQ